MKRFKTIIMTLSVLFSFSAEASGEGGAMTLNDCLVYAREHAPANRLSRLRVQTAATSVCLSASSLMPSLSAYTNGNISFGRNIDPETNTYDTRKTISNSYGLSMSLPLFNGLVNINNLRAARVAKHRQQSSAQVDEDKISIEVIRSFYDVSYARAMVGQMREQLRRDSLILAGVVREFDLGTKSGADVSEMEAVVAADEFELVNQENNLRKTYLNLKGVMGMPLDEADPILSEADMPSLEPGESENPRVAAARLAHKESRIKVDVAKGSFFPTISLSGGISTSYYRLLGDKGAAPGFGRQFRDNMGEYIGLSLSLPIFNGLTRMNNLKMAKLNELSSRLELEQTLYDVEREKADALLDRRAAEDEYIASEKRFKAQETAYHAVKRKFELGSASAIDLFTAGANLASARAAREGKRIQRIISSILLNYYQGGKLIQN